MFKQARRLWRLLAFGFISSCAVVEFLLLGSWRKPAAKLRYQAHWFHRYAKPVLKMMGIQVTPRGTFSKTPLMVSNHLSYMDVFSIVAVHPVIFVSMIEVKKWPWGGLLARCAGTLFIDRKRKSELSRISEAIEKSAAAGVTVCLFAEGTTSDGKTVLPFYSSLLEPAVKNRWKVLPCHLTYRNLENGENKIAWHGAHPFLPHLLELLLQSKTEVIVEAGKMQQSEDRKKLNATLHAEVLRMHGDLSPQNNHEL